MTSCRPLLALTLAIISALFCLAKQSTAQNVAVTVDSRTTYRSVTREDFGINCAAWDSSLTAPGTVAMISKTRVGALRYPGGSWADSFDWTRSKFPGMPTTGTFATLTTRLSANSDIILNYGTGSPQMAAAWVAYCDSLAGSNVSIGKDSSGRDWRTSGYWALLRSGRPMAVDDGLNLLRLNHPSPLNVKWFEVGNECYGSWEADSRLQQHDAVLYAEFFAKTLSLIRRVAPEALVGAVITSDEDSGGDNQETVRNPKTDMLHSGWTSVLLNTLATEHVIPDFVVFHNYPEQPGSESDSGLLSSVSSWKLISSKIISLLSDYFGSAATAIQLQCTECNSVSYNPGKQTTSIVDALYFADSFGAVQQTDFRGLYWWDLHNGRQAAFNNSDSLYGSRPYGDYGILSAENSTGPSEAMNAPYPTYFALQLASLFESPGDTPVAVQSSSSDLSVYAAKHNRRSLSLLIINNNPNLAIAAHFMFVGYKPDRSTTVWRFGKDQDSMIYSGKQVELVPSTLYVPSVFAASFPAYSITVIRLHSP
jgi:alpha-L-arabinofuranosidase